MASFAVKPRAGEEALNMVQLYGSSVPYELAVKYLEREELDAAMEKGLLTLNVDVLSLTTEGAEMFRGEYKPLLQLID